MSLVGLTSCIQQKGEDSIYILPNDYVGYVIIIYNQSDGVDKKYEKDKRIYEIPESGVLKTKFSPDYDNTELPLFYYGEIKEKNKIAVILDPNEFSETKPNVTLPSLNKSYTDIVSSNKIEYAVLYIGTKSQIKESSLKIEEVDMEELVK